MGVGGDARSGQGAVDLGTAGLGVLLSLDDHDCGTLTNDESVTVDVPGTGCVLGVVIAGRQRLHLGEGGHRQRVDDGLGATDDGDVGTSQTDLVQTERDGLR